ncbi:ribonuclease H1-like [Pseudomyrmex gracilis]|uniref:ribonuclease H1-like n=1 Tax=Pseudomyrmex gracilis TaxID=219809 RepID=UPI000994FD86|nr:ribonuclease H1-like [Pseudomyrmex gracilis]XP_020291981.1 ribonuclease H1-like [Pseudomyrmex gracilis]
MILNFKFVARQYFFIMPYYAVARGRVPGIYSTWDECKSQVSKFSGAVYKKFATENEAHNFIKKHSIGKSTSIEGFVSSNIVKTVKSQTPLSGQLFLKRKQSAIRLAQINSLSLYSKNTLSSDDDTNEQIYKKRKIASDNALDLSSSSNQDGKIDFIVDEEGYVNVFTDGACSSNGYKNARAGIGVWFQDNHPLNISQPVEGRATNNMAEIQAVTVAAKQAKKAGIKKLKINTDSKFLISCITQWMPKWKQTGWKTTDNKPVVNKSELLEMEKELESLIIVWNHVSGHKGIHGNEMADKLAREGCLNYKRQQN